MNQIKDFFEYIFKVINIFVIIQPWEQGLIVRRGKHVRKVGKGMYFKIPYLDSVYVQEIRLRIAQLCIQTLTTKDGQTLTLNSAVGYQILDIEKLYQTLYQPDGTIANIAMAAAAGYIFQNNLSDILPHTIEHEVLKKLNEKNYGLKFEYFKITNFAAVKTFRLIQDSQSWIDNALVTTNKR